MIDNKGEEYRTTIVGVLDMFAVKYAANDRAQYIVSYIKE